MLWQDGDQVIAYRQKAIVIFTKGDMAGIGKGYTQSARWGLYQKSFVE